MATRHQHMRDKTLPQGRYTMLQLVMALSNGYWWIDEPNCAIGGRCGIVWWLNTAKRDWP